jgi:uncharacterized protein RhaS with RHS repeats
MITQRVEQGNLDLLGKCPRFPCDRGAASFSVLNIDKFFTGWWLDQTGLYYYNARYYDATIGRFISPDAV